MHSVNSSFDYTVIQGRTRARARLVKIAAGAALIVTDRPLAVSKHLMFTKAAGADSGKTNRLVQIQGKVEKGDEKKLGYVVRLLHAQCPAGLEVLLTFLQQELGVVTQNPAVAEAVNGQSGPVTFRFDTQNFEMGGAPIEEERDEPQPVFRATPIARRVPLAADVANRAVVETESRRAQQELPSLEGDPDEFVSMFGMKVKRGQLDRLGDLTYKPGGAGNAVRSAQRDAPGGGEDDKSKKKKTGLLKRVVLKLTE